MKTLTDIQVELKELSEQIRLLTGDIEQLKPKTVDEIQHIYNDIMKLASKYPIYNKELIKASDITKKYYFYYLAIIADKESSKGIDELLFISRIACGIQYEIGIQEILKDAMSFKEKIFNEGLEIIGNLKYSLLLDMLIVANMTGCASTERLSHVVDLALLLQCDEDDIKILSILSSAILKNSLAEFSKIATVNDNKWSGRFLHIIPKEWLVSYRMHCGTTDNGGVRFDSRWASGIADDEITYCVQQGTLVKQSNKVLEYECMEKNSWSLTTKGFCAKAIGIMDNNFIRDIPRKGSIKAVKDGMVFIKERIDKKLYQAVEDGMVSISREEQRKYKHYIIYVVSSFDDYDDFCEWLKNK